MSQPPGRFATHLAALPAPAGDGDLDDALARPTLASLPVLLSPAALPRLEELAQRAREATLQRFGRPTAVPQLRLATEES